MSFERNLRVAAIVICASVPFAGSAVAAPMIPAKAVRAEAGAVTAGTMDGIVTMAGDMDIPTATAGVRPSEDWQPAP